jgi:hypothetical protein
VATTTNTPTPPTPPTPDEAQRQKDLAAEAATKRKEFDLQHAKATTEAIQDTKDKAAQAAKVPVEKFCVVCGKGSHREDWQDTDSPQCDDHPPASELTKEEREAAGLPVTAPQATPTGGASAEHSTTTEEKQSLYGGAPRLVTKPTSPAVATVSRPNQTVTDQQINQSKANEENKPSTEGVS